MGIKKKEALMKFNQDNILLAARHLFESKGIASTTMDDIAKQADYSKSTLYVYFKSKDEILNTILYDQMVCLKNLLQECLDGYHDFSSCYRAICKELIAFEHRSPIYYELLLGTINFHKESCMEQPILGELYRVGEEINEIVAQMLQNGIAEQIVRADILVIPTVLYLWSGISETIRFANNKKEYLQERFSMSKEEYMEYCFSLLIKSVIEWKFL